MKIRNTLYIGAGISMILVVIVVSVVFITSNEIAEKNKRYKLGHNVHLGVSGLNIITCENLVHHEKRMEQQWRLKYAATARIMADIERMLGKEVQGLATDYAALGDLFSQVNTNYEKTQRLIQEGAPREKINAVITLEKRLVAQLLIKAHSVTTNASRLAEKAHAEVAQAQKLTRNLTLILVIILCTVMTTVSLLVARIISKPLDKLTKGAEIIGKGNLEHRVELKTKDEIGRLAAAFNKMTERRQEAEEALREKTNNLGERVKELNCLYDISHLVEGPDISLEEILQGAVDLIPPSWQYPEITCARITMGEREFRTENFNETVWRQTSDIIVYDERVGTLEVCYLEEKPESYEGPFLKEERRLIDAVAERLGKITERKRAQEEREQLIGELEAKNVELEQFTYTVSHDLKSPLITIKGFLGMLEQDISSGDTQRMKADMARISGAAEKMRRLLDELLELSRIGRLVNPPDEVPLSELVGEVMDLGAGRLAEGNVKVEIAPDPPLVFGDRARLREVLENLIDNAVKFMGDQPNPRIEIGARQDGEETVFYIRDNGIGIDPRYHEKVFGLFDKLDEKTEGTGVGLAIVKRIVEVHGGRIWVESEGTGEGTSFCFTLPKKSETMKKEE